MKANLLFGILLFAIPLCSQNSFCPDDPPVNTFLADSPWPVYHRNNYAQASTCLAGPQAGDSLVVKDVRNIIGATSPWIYFTELYPDGRRAILYSNATHVYKIVEDGSDLRIAARKRIDNDFIRSFGWNFLLARNKVWFTYDPKELDASAGESSRIFKLTDADTTDIESDIVVLDTFDFADIGVKRVQHYQLNYRGEIAFHSDEDETRGYATIGILTQDFAVLDTLNFSTLPEEIVAHNAFPVDEDNAMYVATSRRLIRFGWDGTNLTRDWEAYYDFVNDGPIGTFAEGSGTTPTLMGWGEGNDQLIVLADGHRRNNLVAFWRKLPAGWTGRPGMPLHFADSIQLPAARTFNENFQSIENSPTVRGYEIAVAQFNGFLGYDCDNVKGVQKLRWNETTNALELVWVNHDVNLNGVLTYSAGSNLVYSSGKEVDCNYYFYGLDWETGAVRLRKQLGPEGPVLNDPFYDAGNNTVIAENGDVYFPGGKSLVKIEIARRANGTSMPRTVALNIRPNPVRNFLRVPGLRGERSFEIIEVGGRRVRSAKMRMGSIYVGDLKKGAYFLRTLVDGRPATGRFVKL